MSTIAVVVATCDRPETLAPCLESLLAQSRPAERIVVVDDAPGRGGAREVVAAAAARGPVEYVAGRSRGLAAAHNTALEHVREELVAFTDDDVVADPGWVAAILAGFAATTGVGCVTGRIRPLELVTETQAMLDAYARFDKGTTTRIFDLGEHRPPGPLFPFAAGALGSGANMAFSRAALDAMGGFDPVLGAGTRAKGGDDLAAFFEVLQHGYRLVYAPDALVRHRHAAEPDALERQVYGYGVGLTAYLTRTLVARPRLSASALRGAPAALRHVLAADSDKNVALPARYPPRLRRIERRGMLVGPFAYLASRRAT